MKTFYYEVNEDNRIIWVDEVDRLNLIDPEITSPTIELESIEDVMIWNQGIVDGEIVDMFEDLDVDKTEEYQAELQHIQDWFKSTDWMVNKIIIGEWTENDKRWTDYLKERKAKRERQDELKALLGV